MIRNLMIVTFGAALLAGCSASKSKQGGCDIAAGVCVVGTGVTSSACTGDGGTWEASGCPTADRVGTCVVTGSGSSYTYTAYAPDYDAASAAAGCSAMGGTFTAIGGSTAQSTVSCLWSGDWCWQWTGALTTTDKSDVQSSCSSQGGTYTAAACPTTGTVSGHCNYTAQNASYVSFPEQDYYYTASWSNASDAQADCANWGGTWAP